MKLNQSNHQIVFLILITISLTLTISCTQIGIQGDSLNPSENTNRNPSYEQPSSEEQQNSMQTEINQLKAQLTIALKTKGITPEAHKEINNKINEITNQGFIKEANELRNMLSQLTVGGTEQPNNQSTQTNQTSSTTQLTNNQNNQQTNQQETSTKNNITIWQWDGTSWRPNNTPPPCPTPLLLQSPVDLNIVTAILYPGQVRGNDFKPHGGFRTDKTNLPVVVRAPLDGYIVDVAKFKDEFGIHYLLDIQHPCGILYRLGHLGAVPQEIEAVFSTVPQNKDGDSRTHEVIPTPIKQGDIIATNTQQGSGFDWGVYDLRTENSASKDPSFRAAHADESSQSYHALCWFDYLSPEQEKIVRSLPAADGKSGKTSAYCK